MIMRSEKTSIWRALVNTPASIVLIIYTFIAVWFVGGLTVFHLYLISTNQSTYENFRYRYDGRANPYNKGVIENFKEIFWNSIPASKNKFRAEVQKEPEILPRVVGGSSFVSPNFEKSMSDIEMGRKPIWNEAATDRGNVQGELRNDNSLDEGIPGVRSWPLGEGAEIRSTRGSSMGRRSSSWDIPAEND